MELDITRYALDTDHGTISASQAELGPSAAAYTWRNAQSAADSTDLLPTPEDCDTARDWLGEFGAWTREELAAMPDQDIRALILQFISGDLREAYSCHSSDDDPSGINWESYRVDQESGRCSSYLFRADDGRIYFSLD